MTRQPQPAAVVLGGTGFIGRNVCAALRHAGYHVVAVARRATQPPAGCLLVQVDLTEVPADTLAKTLAETRPSVVVNAAGACWPTEWTRLTDDDLAHGNVTAVENLVAAVAELPDRPRLVHLGSTYEYGAQAAGAAVSEATPERPVNQYGRTKLAGTRRVLAARRDGRVDAVVLRLTATAGPWAPPACLLGMVAHRLVGRPQTLQLPALHGERDFVDARDVADAVLAAASAPVASPVLNVASGRTRPVREVVDQLLDLAGRPIRITWRPAQTRRDATSVGAQHIDIGAARRLLDWTPTRTIQQTLTALWDSVNEEVHCG